MTPDAFDALYGKGAYELVQSIINDLAPETRRDSWWGTPGPYEIIGKNLSRLLYPQR